MSKENLMRFFMLIDQNTDLKVKVDAAIEKCQCKEEMDNIISEDILPLAKEAGLDFSLEDMKALEVVQGEALTNEDPDRVAAGLERYLSRYCNKAPDRVSFYRHFFELYNHSCPNFLGHNLNNVRLCVFCAHLEMN